VNPVLSGDGARQGRSRRSSLGGSSPGACQPVARLKQHVSPHTRQDGSLHRQYPQVVASPLFCRICGNTRRPTWGLKPPRRRISVGLVRKLLSGTCVVDAARVPRELLPRPFTQILGPGRLLHGERQRRGTRTGRAGAGLLRPGRARSALRRRCCLVTCDPWTRHREPERLCAFTLTAPSSATGNGLAIC
jgi:hypothetical protein